MNTLQTYDAEATRTAIEDHHKTLLKIIEDYMLEAGSSHSVEVITDLFGSWVNNEIIQGDNEGKKKYLISSHHTDTMYSTMRLSSFLTALGESWSSIRHLEERLTGSKS
jgi:hypothetical protein